MAIAWSILIHRFFRCFSLVVYSQKGAIIPMLTQIFLFNSFTRIFKTFLGYSAGWHLKLEVI